jgi:predicted ATP-grasp superfamily ATP-dependent carboligase
MTSVLVTDGDERAALAVVRSLGRAGYAVHVCGPQRRTLSAVSRRAVGAFASPDPLRAPAAFVRAVGQYVSTHRIDVVLPISEAALLAVLSSPEDLAGATVPFPPLHTFRAVTDKRALGEVARRIGLAVPPQWEVLTPADADHIDVDALSFPVVLKPARSVGEHEGVRSKQTVRHARDASELRTQLAALPAAAFPVLVQRRLIGPGCGVFLLRWNDVTVASFSHRRIREKPPAGGVSVYAEAVAPDPALVAQSERLLAALDWNGVAMVEYKMDASTGIAYLMEVNGRFWGSLQLAIDAGVDFPALLVQCVLQHALPPTPAYRAGVRGRWWWGEVDHVLARLRRSDAELALPPGSPSRTATVLDFLARWRANERDAVFRFGDPVPFFYESVRWLRRR